MDKLTAIKIKYDDGTYSDEIPVSVLSKNVEWDNTHTLVDVLGSIDVDVTGTIQDQISQLFYEKANSSEVAALKSRIDNFTKLESGSTTGDAELQDIRVGYDGVVYPTAGNAVRESITDLKGDLDTLAENDFIAILNRKLDVIKGKFEKGSIDANGQNVFSNDLIRSIDYIKIYPGIPYQFKTINGNGLAIRIYKSDGSIRSEYMNATATGRTRTITFNSDDEKIRVVINAYKNDYTTYPVSADNFESIIATLPDTGDAELADIRVGADGKTYETAGDAVREQTSQLYESIVEISDNQYNLIENQKLKAVLGAFEKGSINSSGQNEDNNNLLRSTGMIKIYNVYPYTFKTINGNGLVIRIYDSNGVYVRTENMAATATERSRTITFQSTDVYFRLVINAYNNDYANYPVARENLESVVMDVSASIVDKQYIDTKASDVLIKCFSGYGSIYYGNIDIDSVNGTISADSIKVLTNKGKYVSISDGTVSFDKTVAVYIGFEMSDASHSIVARKLDNVMSNDFIMLFAYQNKKIWFADKINRITINGKNYNENVKTICCIGDSFTASNISWHTFIGQNLGYNMVNLGVSGTRMTVTYTSGSRNYECFIDRVANGALNSYSPDLIVLFGGINDTVKLHNNQMYIGTIDDEAEYSASKTSNYSFIGRVKYLINLIKEKKPSAQILGVIPPNYSEGTSGYEWWSEYIAQIQEALRKVYEYYGIPYVDLKKRCQEMYENAYNLSTYRINGRSNMHPSNNGYKAIAKCIQKDGIENMFVN